MHASTQTAWFSTSVGPRFLYSRTHLSSNNSEERDKPTTKKDKTHGHTTGALVSSSVCHSRTLVHVLVLRSYASISPGTHTRPRRPSNRLPGEHSKSHTAPSVWFVSLPASTVSFDLPFFHPFVFSFSSLYKDKSSPTTASTFSTDRPTEPKLSSPSLFSVFWARPSHHQKICPPSHDSCPSTPHQNSTLLVERLISAATLCPPTTNLRYK